jgi:hypothetical protein
MKGSCEGR